MLGTLLAPAPALGLPERPATEPAEAVARLRANAGGALHHVLDPASAYSMLRGKGGQLLVAAGVAGTPQERAEFFLAVYGVALGITDPMLQLAPFRVSTDPAGNTHVHFRQVHRGLEVFGPRVIVHMNAAGIKAVNGVFVPNLEGVGAEPSIDAERGRHAALGDAAKRFRSAALSVEGSRLVVYPVGLLQSRPRGGRLAWEVTVASPDGPVRERVFVDAHDGNVLNRISRIHTVRNREIYTPDQNGPPSYDEHALTATPPSPHPDPPLINDPGHGSTDPSEFPNHQPLDNLWIFAGGTYALYRNLFDRHSYNDCDVAGPCQPRVPAPPWTPTRDLDSDNPPVGMVQKSVYLVNQNCPNAYWNGDSTNYCPGFDADDIVSHEWSHGYTEYTSELIYQWQSGALNEAYSDIYGETYDLTNDIEGPLGDATLDEHRYYDEIVGGRRGSRWVVGEDLSERAAALLLRDMWKPDNFPAANPGKVSSPNYWCDTDDQGGVHFNSSVPNHAYAMLVDGTAGQGPVGAGRNFYNGYTFSGLGMIKAAHIYFQAQAHYQTATTNFPAHAEALEAACEDLKGVDLRGLVDGNPTGQMITDADCVTVQKAMLAVEMRLPPSQCGFKPMLLPESTTPPLCSEGTPDIVLAETWEGGAIPAGWTLTSTAGPTGDAWPGTKWTVVGGLPASRAGQAAFAIDPRIGQPNGGTCQPGGDVSGQFSLDSPPVTLTSSGHRLKFTHFMQSEANYDGGNLKYSVNDGLFEIVPDAAFIHNPHSGTLATVAGQNTNPMGGEDAWHGTDEGEVTGSWGTTIVDLDALGAGAGDKIVFRWDFGQDGCNGNLGWFVDDVTLAGCPVLDAPELALGPDYEDPDTDGSFTLEWERPALAVGPDQLQRSTEACEPLVRDTAENLNNWTAASSAAPSPIWTTSSSKPQHEGNSAFWANPVSEQETQDSEATLTLKKSLALPFGRTVLRFKEWYFNENDDSAHVEVSSNGGPWTRVYTNARSMGALPDEGAAAFADEPLKTVTVDLTPYGGTTIRLRFRYMLGPSNFFFFTQYGWYVDDVEVVSENWLDVTTTDTTAHTLSGLLDGRYCFRVRTHYDISGQLAASPYSNVVTADVNASLANLPPVPRIAADPGSGKAPLDVTFDASASDDPNGDPVVGYRFDFGDGSPPVTQGSPLITHRYSSAGKYTAELTVTDPQGLSSTTPATIEIEALVSNRPIARLTPRPATVRKGEEVELDASASTDPDGDSEIDTYEFDLDDGGGPIVQGGSKLPVTYLRGKEPYKVAVVVKDVHGLASIAAVADLTVLNAAPVIKTYVADPVSGNAPLAVSFSATAEDPDSELTADQPRWYEFDFGDGSPVEGVAAPAVTYTYAQPGLYDAKVWAFDEEGKSSAAALVQIDIPNQLPVAKLTIPDKTVGKKLPVTFDASASSDAEGPLGYRFDFGDGSPFVFVTGPDAPVVTHSYVRPGTYTATVTVTDGSGAQASASDAVTITNEAPVAVLTASTTEIAPTGSVVFSATGSSDPDHPRDKVAQYTFTFGDGTAPVTQAGPHVTHAYMKAGTYAARLVVADEDGAASAPVFLTIEVTAGDDTHLLGGGLPLGTLALLGALALIRRRPPPVA